MKSKSYVKLCLVLVSVLELSAFSPTALARYCSETDFEGVDCHVATWSGQALPVGPDFYNHLIIKRRREVCHGTENVGVAAIVSFSHALSDATGNRVVEKLTRVERAAFAFEGDDFFEDLNARTFTLNRMSVFSANRSLLTDDGVEEITKFTANAPGTWLTLVSNSPIVVPFDRNTIERATFRASSAWEVSGQPFESGDISVELSCNPLQQ